MNKEKVRDALNGIKTIDSNKSEIVSKTKKITEDLKKAQASMIYGLDNENYDDVKEAIRTFESAQDQIRDLIRACGKAYEGYIYRKHFR